MLRLRPADQSDVGAISAVHVRAWQRAYRGIMPDEYLDELRPSVREPFWQRFSVDYPKADVVVADADGVVAGFIATASADDDELVGEVHVLNVDPQFWSQGIGGRLLAVGCGNLVRRGFPEGVLWVVKENARARTFYERNGWQNDGAIRDYVFGGCVVPDVRYRRRLKEPASAATSPRGTGSRAGSPQAR